MAQDDPDLPEALADSLMNMADTRAAIAEANDFPVPIEHFKKAVRFIARMGSDQDLVKRAWAMTVIFAGRVSHDELLPMQRAFELRMQALASLKNEPDFRAWSLQVSADAPAAIEEVLVEVAAVEPIVERDGRSVFDAERFFRTVLARTVQQGRA